MRLRHEGDVLVVRLPEECRIFDVEAHWRLALEVDWAGPGWTVCRLEAGAVKDMDTAYFQFLLAMSLSARLAGKVFSIAAPNPIIEEIAALYGQRP